MKKRILFLSIFLVIALSACNLPTSGSENVDDLALTVTAQHLLLNQPSAEPQFTATPEFTATPGFTSTPSVPQVTVSTNTNCRTGHTTQFDNIDSLLVGQIAEVVGKNTQTGYWIIKRLNGSGICWLFPQYATVTGNTSNLPEYPLQPTPTPSKTPTPTVTATLAAPVAVDNLTMTMACPNAIHSGTLNWTDKSNNEDGFNIYANGVLLASIPANSTSYNVAAAPGGPFLPGIASNFEVEAFNGAGKATKKSIPKGCP